MLHSLLLHILASNRNKKMSVLVELVNPSKQIVKSRFIADLITSFACLWSLEKHQTTNPEYRQKCDDNDMQCG